MSGAVSMGMWYIIYMNGQPCILAGGPVNVTHDQALEKFRTMMLGTLPEGTTIDVKTIYDADINDVIRVSAIALMTSLTKVASTVDQMAQAMVARGLLRTH